MAHPCQPVCAENPERRYPERPDCWHVYYGDVHVGTSQACVYRKFDSA
jgi:hypothetical protein